MQTHNQLVKKLLRRRGVRTEVDRIEREEAGLLDALLKARQEAGLTQSQVAVRMGTTGSGGRSSGAGPSQWETFAIDCDVAEVCQGLWQAAGAAGCISPLRLDQRVDKAQYRHHDDTILCATGSILSRKTWCTMVLPVKRTVGHYIHTHIVSTAAP